MISAVIHLSRVEIINTGWTLILRGSLYKVYLINSFVGAKEWHHKYPTCADEVAIGKTVLKSMGCCINELIPPPTPPIVSSFERRGVCVYNTEVSSLAMGPIFRNDLNCCVVTFLRSSFIDLTKVCKSATTAVLRFSAKLLRNKKKGCAKMKCTSRHMFLLTV